MLHSGDQVVAANQNLRGAVDVVQAVHHVVGKQGVAGVQVAVQRAVHLQQSVYAGVNFGALALVITFCVEVSEQTRQKTAVDPHGLGRTHPPAHHVLPALPQFAKGRGHGQAAHPLRLLQRHLLRNRSTQRLAQHMGPLYAQVRHQAQSVGRQHGGGVGVIGRVGATYAPVVKGQHLEVFCGPLQLSAPGAVVAAGITAHHDQPAACALDGVIHLDVADVGLGHGAVLCSTRSSVCLILRGRI